MTLRCDPLPAGGAVKKLLQDTHFMVIGSVIICCSPTKLKIVFSKILCLYCNPPALGRDLAHIIITHPLSNTHAWTLMSAAAYTGSGFTQWYLWPVWSTPYDLLPGGLSWKDTTFIVGPVVLPGLCGLWPTIRVRCPNREVGTTWGPLARTPRGAAHEWHMVWPC